MKTKKLLAMAFFAVLLYSCNNNLTREKAEQLISEKYKFPYPEMVALSQPQIKIWMLNQQKNNCCKPTFSLLDTITETGKMQSLGYLAAYYNREKSSCKAEGAYMADGDIGMYRKYKELGIIEFNSVKTDSICVFRDENGILRKDFDGFIGNDWHYVFSLTAKASELGINNWQYKAAEWVLDDINKIHTDETDKIVEIEITIKTVNPTSAANLFGWNEKKQNLKLFF